MLIQRRFKDKYAGSSPENASVVRTLFDLFFEQLTKKAFYRVAWGKMGHFFRFSFCSSSVLEDMKNFIGGYGQCMFPLQPQKKIAPKKSMCGWATPRFFLKGR